MKSRRKIWSLPLVLVTALLLVGLFAASVLAQTTAPSLTSANINAAINGDSPPGTTDEIATIVVEDFGDYEPVAEFGASDGPPPVAAFDNPAIIGGPTFRDDSDPPVSQQIFEIDDLTPVAGDDTMREADITLTTAAATAISDGDLTLANRYSFRVRIILDEDGVESDDDDNVLERDLTLNANVTINVLKRAADELRFDVDPSKALKNAQVSQLGHPIDSSPMQWQITGIGSSMKLVDIVQDDNEANFELRETPAGSGKFGLFVVNSTPDLDAASDLTIQLQYDEDKAVNANPPADPTDVQANEDMVADNDVNVTITLNGTITPREGLAFTGDNLGDPDTEATRGQLDADEEFHYEFTIASNTVSGTPIGSFGIDGRIEIADTSGANEPDNSETEYLDGIVSGSDAAPFDVRDSDMTLTYDGSPALEVGAYEFDLTVSGDAGLANRTIIGKVQVTVAASNEAPDAPTTFSKTLAEDEPDIGIIMKAGAAVGDASAGVDPVDGDSLTYSLGGDDHSLFAIDPETGMVTVGTNGIGDTVKDEDASTEATDTTPAVNKYMRADSGTLADVDDKYSNVTYEFTVTVSDGVSANNKTINATVVVVPNSPTTAVAEANLPAGVTYDAEHKVHVDDDDDPATPAANDDGDADETDTPVDTPTYFVTAEYSDREVPVVIIDLVGLVSDANTGDTLTYTITDDGTASHIVDSGSELLLTYLPPGSKDAPAVDVLMVDVRDGYNSDESIDVSLRIEISITEIDKPITSSFVTFHVMENTQVCSANADGTGACSLAGIVTDGDSYSIESGVGYKADDGSDNFSINGDGVIVVDGDIDYEDVDTARQRPSFLVNVDDAGGELAGIISVSILVGDENEAPVIAAIAGTPWVYETAQDDEAVVEKPPTQAGPGPDDLPISIDAEDPEDEDITYSIVSATDVPFDIDPSTGALTVDLEIGEELDHETTGSYTFMVQASDGTNDPQMPVTVHIIGSNEAPNFTSPAGDDAKTAIDEDRTFADGPIPFGDGSIMVFSATDEDGNDLTFELREGVSRDLFEIHDVQKIGDGHFTGELRVKENGPGLDYDDPDIYSKETGHRVHVEVQDGLGLSDTLLLEVRLNNVNDNAPEFNVAPALTLTVSENRARGHVLGNYGATDADDNTVSYSLGGDDANSFMISDTGDLMTLESLDADSGTPCGSDGCLVTVIASDGTHSAPTSAIVLTPPSVRITVTGVEDSVSTPHITKANPVPGVGQGKAESALAGLKATADVAKAPPESPDDLPATYGDEGKGPKNYVETEWANWGTVLRIEVTAESPSATCGEDVGAVARNNNQCVEIIVKSDSAGDVLKLAAYRSNEQEDRYVAAVMLVEIEAHASNYLLDSDGDEDRTPIYRHQRVRNKVASATATDPVLQVPRLYTDEEDEIEIEFGNLRADIDVENEPPEIGNFAPEHEDAFDDPDVDYAFTVTDDNSGLSEPEDLPDGDGDENYTPVVGLVSDSQCELVDTKTAKGIPAYAIHIHEDDWLNCGDDGQDGEYNASESGHGFAPIRDDKDFDKISDGYEVETTLVLVKNEIRYVTFIACDQAGNCTSFDPDGNDDEVELAEITIDTELPDFVEARTGVKWDSSDNEYDDDRSFIQVIFDDLTPLNEETVEADDFVVEGHTIKAVYVYSPDGEDTLWGDENSDGTLNEDTDPTRYANGGPNSEWGDRGALYRKINRTVFLELEDELLADETPDVTVVPNGVEDKAGNEQDDGDVEAKDWIAPRFVIVSIVAADTPEGASNQLAGDGDEVTVMVTSDERLDQTRPDVTVTYVDASMVDTKGTAECGTDGKRKRGEITMDTAGNTSAKCADNSLATGDDLNNHIEKITNTEWVVTVTKPKATGYYNFHIAGEDRSPKKNKGSEGVSAGSIVTDFFDSDGDVNTDDAVFWEADINLPNPNIRVSGVAVTDNEASVEFRSPLFVEIDFTVDHWAGVDCDDVETDDRMANCMNENSEYSEDNFDDVVVTMFELDGVDMTDSVKTTDSQTFLVSLESVSVGDHTVLIQAVDQAGNTLEDTLEIDFEVNDRDPFEKRLSPGWNLVSLPGEPANSSIASVFGSDVEVRTVYTYDPVIPGGWMVAVRETLESDWQGDLTEISGQRGYWVLSDAIQDWEVSIPRLAGGAAGTGTPIQPPVIALYAGWNLIPVIDISGDASGGDTIDADIYLRKLDDGLDLARVLGYNTIRNQWQTVLDRNMAMSNTLEVGSAYWIFVREAASLVPSGYVGGGGGD